MRVAGAGAVGVLQEEDGCGSARSGANDGLMIEGLMTEGLMTEGLMTEAEGGKVRAHR